MTKGFLEGHQVYLRALTEADADGPYLNWFNDSFVSEHNGHHFFPFSREDALAYIRRMGSPNDELALAVAAADDDRHIGNVALKKIDRIAMTAEIALVIGDRSMWGRGVGSEVCRLMMDHAFDTLNLRRIHCATYETNVAMQKLAVALGMREEGRRRQAAFKNGKYIDIIEFGVLCDEYEAARQ